MSISTEFMDHILDLLQSFGAVEAKRMFGGYGLFRSGLMFALVSDDILYFKVDAQNRSAFETRGLKCFSYKRQGKPVALSYYEAPANALEDKNEMRLWAEAAYAAALRAKRD